MGKLNVDTGVITAEIEAGEIAALRKDAKRYRWLREHFRFANDSMRELWFDPVLEPNDSGVQDDLDQEIDRAMTGANAKIRGGEAVPLD